MRQKKQLRLQGILNLLTHLGVMRLGEKIFVIDRHGYEPAQPTIIMVQTLRVLLSMEQHPDSAGPMRWFKWFSNHTAEIMDEGTMHWAIYIASNSKLWFSTTVLFTFHIF